MFKNHTFNTFLILGIILIALLTLISGELDKAEQANIDISKELNKYGILTEALTYDYKWSQKNKRINVTTQKRFIVYVYFVDGKKYEFEKEVNANDMRFQDLNKHENPMIWKLIYSSKNPRLNQLILDTPLDTITNKELENFIVDHYDLSGIDKFFKIFDNKLDREIQPLHK